MEKTSISNRSTKLFTLSGIYQGTQSLLRKPDKVEQISDEETALAVEYWQTVTDNMRDWKLAAEKEVSTYELRRDYVHAHTLAIHVFGRLGSSLLSTPDIDYKSELKRLDKIDWARKNSALWEGRAMINGKISKSHTCMTLTTNYLKTSFGLPLSPDEHEVEEIFARKS